MLSARVSSYSIQWGGITNVTVVYISVGQNRIMGKDAALITEKQISLNTFYNIDNTIWMKKRFLWLYSTKGVGQDL